MHTTPAAVYESSPGSTRLRDLKLAIAGTPLERVIEQFRSELVACGVTRIQPHFYLSTEWGVPFGTVSIALPFYLARTDLTALHAERSGHVEGVNPVDILRYLRHEMGHVINYAYRLYETEDWHRTFGDIEQPYEEEYYPLPFSRDYVRNLPGWYAQKHPDEDWAETFAVWMTPDEDWRSEYASWPALAKLEYCDHVMTGLREREPLVTATDPDEDVGSIGVSLDDYYQSTDAEESAPGKALDATLRSIFQDRFDLPDAGGAPQQSGADLIRKLQAEIQVDVYRWTGLFPERTRALLRHLAERAEQQGLAYPANRATDVAVALTAFVTSLAMNRVLERRMLPGSNRKPV